MTSWQLIQGDVLLGTLVLKEVDQPFFLAGFEPTDEFERVRELFEEELRLAEADYSDDHAEAVEAAYNRIIRLGLLLKPLDGSEPISDFLLHIRGDEAWFRY